MSPPPHLSGRHCLCLYVITCPSLIVPSMHMWRFAYELIVRIIKVLLCILLTPPSRQLKAKMRLCVCVCVCAWVCVRETPRQGADGSWWVSTPAAATSTLGQLMFSELTGISPIHSNVQPSSPLVPAQIDCPCNGGLIMCHRRLFFSFFLF